MIRCLTGALLGAVAGVLLLPMPVAWGSPQAAVSPTEFEPAYADHSAIVLLSAARAALRELGTEAQASERRLRCAGAISALTRLYQLHGCAWALRPLREVYTHPDCPDLHLACSADGRLELRIEPLELKNPAFADYTVYLCTMSSHTALNLTDAAGSALVIGLRDGTRLTAQRLSPDHALWIQLDRLADTFEPPVILPAGGGIAFKQLFAVPDLCPDDISKVSLEWGDYELSVPYYENEVGL